MSRTDLRALARVVIDAGGDLDDLKRLAAVWERSIPKTPDWVSQRVLAAIECGTLPPGGPSELAARDLVDEAPGGYLERWADRAAERIRARARAVRCTCADGGEVSTADGRCSRCWGRPREQHGTQDA